MQRQRHVRCRVGQLLPSRLHAAHHELEVSEVVALVRRDHQERTLVAGPPVQPVAAVEHEDLEGGDAEVLDDRGDLVDVLPHHRREVESVVDERASFRGGQHVREELRVRATPVEVVLPRTHVGQSGRHTALGAGAALGGGVLGQRVVDAPVLVRVDRARVREPAAPVHDGLRLVGRDVGLHPHHLAAGNADVQPIAVGRAGVGPDHGYVLDQGFQQFHAFPPVIRATWFAAR